MVALLLCVLARCVRAASAKWVWCSRRAVAKQQRPSSLLHGPDAVHMGVPTQRLKDGMAPVCVRVQARATAEASLYGADGPASNQSTGASAGTMAGIFGMCSTVRAGQHVSRSTSASSLHTTPSRLEFASWPDGAALPPPGHSFWCVCRRPAAASVDSPEPRAGEVHTSFLTHTLPSLPVLSLYASQLPRKQAHAADVAIQAITSLQRDRHNLEVQLQGATGKAANERLQQTLNAVQARAGGGAGRVLRGSVEDSTRCACRGGGGARIGGAV